MDRIVVHVRRVGIACVGLLSVAVGVGSIWVVASPDVIVRTPTLALVGVLGLLVLPLAAAGALVLDRRAAVESRATRRIESPRAAADSRTARPPVPRPGLGAEAGVPAARSHQGSSGHHTDAARHRHLRAGVGSGDL